MYRFSNIAFLAVTLVSFAAGVFALPPGNISSPLFSDVIPTSPIGSIGAVQVTSGDTRIYFQDSTGAIVQYAVSNSFNIGSFESNVVIAPANEVKRGTPVAVAGSADLAEIHVFFFSPSNTLSEYYWSNGWHGGSGCTTCITTNGFAGAGTGNTLYAMENPSSKQLRVGFISAASPSGLAEAIGSGTQWSVSVLN